MKFARLFELENGGQMLVTMDYNAEEEAYSLVYRTEIGGISSTVAFGFSPDKDVDFVRAKLEALTMNDAVSIWNILRETFNL